MSLSATVQMNVRGSGCSMVNWVISVCFTLLLSGCSVTSQHPRDPLEPVNRVVYQFNDKADAWVLKPVAETYHDYTPQLLRTGISNFFSNLGDASSAVNYSLQWRGEPAVYSMARFILNSTVGILGFMDMTGEDGHRRFPQTGFGDTFARWGWKNSSYLVLPLLGPSTVRDGTGTVAGMAFQENVLYGQPHQDAMALSNTISGISKREKLLGIEETINEAALDSYSYTRDVWLQTRARTAGDTVTSPAEEDLDIDELMK